MKAPNFKTCTEEELWEYVASHLASRGIETILVGGAVVSIYSEGAYRSGDLDIVLRGYLREKLPEAMAEIGFSRSHSRHYSRPGLTHLIVDFASPPAAIGDDYQIEPASRVVEGGKIYIYSPTDCVRDRLASYIHFQARECLDQAALVADKHPVDLKKIQTWCVKEGGAEAFREFKELLSGKRKKKK
jgi:hypothetical protein